VISRTIFSFVNEKRLSQYNETVKSKNVDGKEKSSSFPPIAGFPLRSNKRANPEE